MSAQAESVAERNHHLLELLPLDVRMYLMFALLLIVMIGLVLLLFTSAEARHLRRQKLGRPAEAQDPDDWARRSPAQQYQARKGERKQEGSDKSSPDERAEPGGGE